MSRQCDEITAIMYPDKMTVDEFARNIMRDFDNFIKNMKQIDAKNKYAEEWMTTLAAWMEMI